MKKIIALLLVSATLVASAPAFAGDTSTSPLCAPDAPEAYKRPGGYCEQIASNKSLVPTTENEYIVVIIDIAPSVF